MSGNLKLFKLQKTKHIRKLGIIMIAPYQMVKRRLQSMHAMTTKGKDHRGRTRGIPRDRMFEAINASRPISVSRRRVSKYRQQEIHEMIVAIIETTIIDPSNACRCRLLTSRCCSILDDWYLFWGLRYGL
uniref:Uncharacterized protein n=1 Tax=Spongospora subterranea TaxID=70186 RepID=A0A0H5R848_9EUKA|eukprot:CRZ04484.1 hypothetical protein [Spongospora subterranea]